MPSAWWASKLRTYLRPHVLVLASTGGMRHRISGVGIGARAIASTSASARA